MSALDYYGRLLRRAQASVDAGVARVRDPFDATEPWLLDEREASPSVTASAIPGVALQPATPAPVSSSLPRQEVERDAGFEIESSPGTAAAQDLGPRPPTSEVFKTFTVRHEETPDIPAARAIALEPSEQPRAIHQPAILATPIERDERPAVVTLFHDREVDAAVPPSHRPTAAAVPLTPSPPVPLATAWPQDRDEPPPAAPPPVSTLQAERPTEERRPAPAPVPQVIVVRERAAGAWRDQDAADQDLLRGPTHQPFGIGQV